MTMVTNVIMRTSHVEFEAGGARYTYIPTRGRLYVGGFGTPVHESDMGSFEISDRVTGDEVASHAALLGATVSRMR
jgi:hypothetical protein